MPLYRVEFDRVGRRRELPAVEIMAADGQDLAVKVRKIVRPYLGSSDILVSIDMDDGRGWIACGFHSGGDFRVKEVLR